MGGTFDFLFITRDEYIEWADSVGRMGGSGLRRLIDGDINAPGLITLVIIVGVFCFLYWTFKHR